MRKFAFAETGEGFVPPSTADFNLPPVFGNSEYTTKPVLLVIFSVILISAFFIISSRKALVVPNKLQFAGESVYAFVRNGIGEEIIGHEFMRFVPFLFTLFTFIITNNIFGELKTPDKYVFDFNSVVSENKNTTQNKGGFSHDKFQISSNSVEKYKGQKKIVNTHQHQKIADISAN